MKREAADAGLVGAGVIAIALTGPKEEFAAPDDALAGELEFDPSGM